MKTMKTVQMKNTFKVLGLACLSVFAASCSDDDIAPINEEEVITTVEYTLANTADASNIVIYKSVDADGDGPNDPIETVTGTLMANASYTGSVRFLNELESPVENITLEVIEEGDEHEVFYISSIPNVSVSKNDVDVNGDDLGVETTLNTGTAGTGTLTVVLRHEPMKPNDGTLINAGGETDVQVEFDIDVQ